MGELRLTFLAIKLKRITQNSRVIWWTNDESTRMIPTCYENKWRKVDESSVKIWRKKICGNEHYVLVIIYGDCSHHIYTQSSKSVSKTHRKSFQLYGIFKYFVAIMPLLIVIPHFYNEQLHKTPLLVLHNELLKLMCESQHVCLLT